MERALPPPGAMTATAIPARATERGWPWRIAIAFVLLTLAALVLVPWAVQRRVDVLRREIVAAEPARTLVLRWQFDLVRELSTLTELLLTGDTTQIATYTAALAEERRIHASLEPLAARLGPEVASRYAEARTLARQWHVRVRQDELLRLRAAGTPPGEIARERPLFEETLRAVGRIDSAIVRATGRARREISAAERAGLQITFLLGFLAFLAAAVVVAFDARVRRLAAESERRRIAAERALAEAARAEEARARLLRGITHDVKNPLGAARGYAELLAMGVKAPLAPEQRPLVEGVERSIDGALAIIADLLDLARADGGGLSIERAQVDLERVAREAADDFRAAAETAGHTLTVEPAPAPIEVYTDPVRVRQILDNLLSNAIKYTPPPGHVTVRTGRVDGDAGPRSESWATVEVSDTGPGILPEQRETVFEEFTRLSESAPAEGHGLGLAVSRGLARRLGGDLTIADAGPGATFVLWLPRRDA